MASKFDVATTISVVCARCHRDSSLSVGGCIQALLEDLSLPREAVMAIGDGGNDAHIVANAGIGIAMGNAVPQVHSPSLSPQPC